VNLPLENLFRIFPNPASSVLTLEWKGGERSQLEIIGTQGNVVLSKTIDDLLTRLEIGHLPPGIYILRIQAGTLRGHKTFIKQ